jgi:hypothetical protein
MRVNQERALKAAATVLAAGLALGACEYTPNDPANSPGHAVVKAKSKGKPYKLTIHHPGVIGETQPDETKRVSQYAWANCWYLAPWPDCGNDQPKSVPKGTQVKPITGTVTSIEPNFGVHIRVDGLGSKTYIPDGQAAKNCKNGQHYPDCRH